MGINERGSIEKQHTDVEADTLLLPVQQRHTQSFAKKKEKTMPAHIYLVLSDATLIVRHKFPYLKLKGMTHFSFKSAKATFFSCVVLQTENISRINKHDLF